MSREESGRLTIRSQQGAHTRVSHVALSLWPRGASMRRQNQRCSTRSALESSYAYRQAQVTAGKRALRAPQMGRPQNLNISGETRAPPPLLSLLRTHAFLSQGGAGLGEAGPVAREAPRGVAPVLPGTKACVLLKGLKVPIAVSPIALKAGTCFSLQTQRGAGGAAW